jgi:hypothetical protein
MSRYRRTIEVTTVLGALVSQVRGFDSNRTNAEPIKKIARTPIFFRVEICNLTTIGIGMQKIMTSVMTPNAAVALKTAGRSMQTPSVTETSYAIAMGLQANATLKRMPKLEPTTTKMVNQTLH